MQVFRVLILPVVLGLLFTRLTLFPDSVDIPIHQTYCRSGTFLSAGNPFCTMGMWVLVVETRITRAPVFRVSPMGTRTEKSVVCNVSFYGSLSEIQTAA